MLEWLLFLVFMVTGALAVNGNVFCYRNGGLSALSGCWGSALTVRRGRVGCGGRVSEAVVLLDSVVH